MRLESVRRGTGIKRLLLPVMSWKVDARVPDVVRTLIHRPAFFGKGYNAWIQALYPLPKNAGRWIRVRTTSGTRASTFQLITGRSRRLIPVPRRTDSSLIACLLQER